ncbi:MAG: sugar ABC transporter permease, partial [Methylobacteriaceae bacterium]|nr:sugar ABC transporter permease [Methylobacteriaceae bacterium]
MVAEVIAGHRAQGRRPILGRYWRTALFCYVALLPVLALFAYVRVIPIGFSLLLSFYKWNLISPLKPFIGLANYNQLMSDENFRLALINTTIYSLSTVVLSALITLP